MPERQFIHDDFLLESGRARLLYHEYAAAMPVIDYHCHLQPAEVADNRRWDNLAQIWLYGDHYKWRAMRSNGVDERYCTGDAADREKFEQFAATMPRLLRNPLYDWSHLELARYFNVTDRLLCPETAGAIWDQANDYLARPEFSARGLMEQSRVKLVCTTDDPADSLEHHRAIAADSRFAVKVLPSWRPDKALAIDRPVFFNAWVDRLGEAATAPVSDFSDFLSALRRRHQDFSAAGCRLSDYGVETLYDVEPAGEEELAAVFRRVRNGETPTPEEIRRYRMGMMDIFGRMDAAAGWTWQIHYGAMRNNNSRMFDRLGPDTGFDSIGDWPAARGLSRMLDRLDRVDSLPRTIIYTLDPSDNEVVATMLGNFQRGPVPGKLQFGSGWWFNDQRDGMLRQIEALSQLGLLSRFVGMLTDSRSFLSYTRHEYFRRILCNLLGGEMQSGRIPDDAAWIGEIVRDICYRNAVAYFGFDLPEEPATVA